MPGWLRDSGLEPWLGALLEAAAPLAPLGAQALYLVEPLAGGRRAWLRDWARRLEEPEALLRLAEQLQEGEV